MPCKRLLLQWACVALKEVSSQKCSQTFRFLSRVRKQQWWLHHTFVRAPGPRPTRITLWSTGECKVLVVRFCSAYHINSGCSALHRNSLCYLLLRKRTGLSKLQLQVIVVDYQCIWKYRGKNLKENKNRIACSIYIFSPCFCMCTLMICQ